MYRHILFIYLSVVGHWGCLNVLAIVKNGAMNIGVQHLLKFLFSILLGINLGVELWGYNKL